MDVNDIVDIENGSKSNENEVQAPIMEDGNARSDDQVADEPSAGANTAATPLLGKKKKCLGVENRVVKQRTTTPMSKLKASKAVASSKDRAIVLVPSLAKVVQSTSASASASANASASAPNGNQSANTSASAQGSIGDNEEEENDVKIGKELTSWVWEHFTRLAIWNWRCGGFALLLLLLVTYCCNVVDFFT